MSTKTFFEPKALLTHSQELYNNLQTVSESALGTLSYFVRQCFSKCVSESLEVLIQNANSWATAPICGRRMTSKFFRVRTQVVVTLVYPSVGKMSPSTLKSPKMLLSQSSGGLYSDKQKLSWTLEGLFITLQIIVHKYCLVKLQWSDWAWRVFQSVGLVTCPSMKMFSEV